MKAKNKLGSNQWKIKHRGLSYATKRSIVLIVLICALGVIASLAIDKKVIAMQPKILSPLPMSPVVITAEYKEPPMADMKGQAKAIEIIKRTWRKDWKIGVKLAVCESGLRDNATNDNTDGTRDGGYFQINSIHKIDASDPVANAAFAYILYKEQGTGPWNASAKCWKNKI